MQCIHLITFFVVFKLEVLFIKIAFDSPFFFKITSLNSYMLAGVKFKLRLNNNGNNAFQLISATEK